MRLSLIAAGVVAAFSVATAAQARDQSRSLARQPFIRSQPLSRKNLVSRAVSKHPLLNRPAPVGA
jgi:hypothetical protein